MLVAESGGDLDDVVDADFVDEEASTAVGEAGDIAGLVFELFNDGIDDLILCLLAREGKGGFAELSR